MFAIKIKHKDCIKIQKVKVRKKQNNYFKHRTMERLEKSNDINSTQQG